MAGGLLVLGVEACDGREFMRVYESLREIKGEIGVGLGWWGWWGLAGMSFGCFWGEGGWAGRPGGSFGG